MNYLSTLTIIILSTLSIFAHADSMLSISTECSKLSALIKKYDMYTEGYSCGEDIKNLKRFRLKDLNKPIAADRYINQEGHDDYSSAYYVGHEVLDGIISYPESANDHFAFQTKNDYFNFGRGYDENDHKSINQLSNL